MNSGSETSCSASRSRWLREVRFVNFFLGIVILRMPHVFAVFSGPLRSGRSYNLKLAGHLLQQLGLLLCVQNWVYKA
jgi:hypothetical protein